jgi:hypothetical protein
MKKLFLIVLLLPLLFAWELKENEWRIPLGIREWECFGETVIDTTWLLGTVLEIDTIYSPTVIYLAKNRYERYPLPVPIDTFYAPKLIIEYKVQKFKIMLSPIIEEEG